MSHRNLLYLNWLLLMMLCSSRSVFAAQDQVADRKDASKEVSMALAVQDNMDVGIEYTLTSDGVVVDSTEGKSSFHYVQGHGQIIPGLERQLAGMRVGEAKQVTVGPNEAYGELDPAAVVEVPREQLPKDVTPAVGIVLRGVNPDGKNFRATIKELKEKTVLLDLNHPLAGKTLVFNVKITDIAPAKAQ